MAACYWAGQHQQHGPLASGIRMKTYEKNLAANQVPPSVAEWGVRSANLHWFLAGCSLQTSNQRWYRHLPAKANSHPPYLLADCAWRPLLLAGVLCLALHGLVLLEAGLRAKVLELPLLTDRRQEAPVPLRRDVALAVCAHLRKSEMKL